MGIQIKGHHETATGKADTMRWRPEFSQQNA
jgi:hypothetical protein